ncbi:hypothetical protein [Methylocella sp.]|jgi:hypothetical protein|uniref:hypothetical protein n=1 Tax=Methylocella sp. TaxID=1978226 RepID=UPI003C196CF6
MTGGVCDDAKTYQIALGIDPFGDISAGPVAVPVADGNIAAANRRLTTINAVAECDDAGFWIQHIDVVVRTGVQKLRARVHASPFTLTSTSRTSPGAGRIPFAAMFVPPVEGPHFSSA